MKAKSAAAIAKSTEAEMAASLIAAEEPAPFFAERRRAIELCHRRLPAENNHLVSAKVLDPNPETKSKL